MGDVKNQKSSARAGNSAGPPRLRWLQWLGAGVCAGVILTLGSPLFSYVRTGAIIGPVLSAILPGAGPDAIARWHIWIRWSAHFIEYALLFLALALGPMRRRPMLAFGACLLIATLDESLQLLTASRSGRLADVALDMTGPATMLMLALPFWENRAWRQTAPPARGAQAPLKAARRAGRA